MEKKQIVLLALASVTLSSCNKSKVRSEAEKKDSKESIENFNKSSEKDAQDRKKSKSWRKNR